MKIETKIDIQEKLETTINTMQSLIYTGFTAFSFAKYFNKPLSLLDVHNLFNLEDMGSSEVKDIIAFELSIDDQATFFLKFYYKNEPNLVHHEEITDSLNDTGDITDVIYFATALATESFEGLLDFENQAKEMS